MEINSAPGEGKARPVNIRVVDEYGAETSQTERDSLPAVARSWLLKRKWPGVVVVAGFAVAGWTFLTGGEAALVRHTVGQVHLSFAIDERGSVRPAQVAVIKSSIASNRATLIWMEQQGAEVAKGDVIARFDTQPFDDELHKAQQKVLDARATLEEAKKNELIQREEREATLEAAERVRRIARLNADDQINGTGQLERRKLEQQVEKARRLRDIAIAELEDYELLLVKGHVSERERDRVADELQSAEETLNIAEQELTNFEQYRWPAIVTEADQMREAAELEYQRAVRTGEIKLQQRRDDVVRAERIVKAAEQEMEKAIADIENCEVTAPISGILLHKRLVNAPEGRYKVGDAVWFGQAFMEIPDNSDFVVETSVREVDVARVAPGQSVLVSLDAFPEATIRGEVESVGSVAEEKGEAYAKTYNVRVKLLEDLPGIHAGMSASVEIIYAPERHVLAVPVSAVEYTGSGPVVQVADGDHEVARRVKLGDISGEWAEVEAGLDIGEEVILRSL